MPHFPSFDEFRAFARTHTAVPVYRRLTGDTLTPVTAFGKIQEGHWSFLFESVVGGERLGRYSFLGSGPFLLFRPGIAVFMYRTCAPARKSDWKSPIPCGCSKTA